MRLPRSTYYYQSRKNPSISDEVLKEMIEAIIVEFPTYGVPRVTAELKRRSIGINHKRIERVMRENHLQCRPRKRYRASTTDSNHDYPIAPNLAKNLTPKKPNELWVADITYIRLLSGFVYLAVILDAFSRKVIGYAVSRTIDRHLCLAALMMAIERRRPKPGCIHHSDRGVQYASHDYVDRLRQHGLRPSMSERGNPYDNAMAESFMKTLKYDEVYLEDYRTLADAIHRLPHFIEAVYNAKRLHSSIGYCPPDEFEAAFDQRQISHRKEVEFSTGL